MADLSSYAHRIPPEILDRIPADVLERVPPEVWDMAPDTRDFVLDGLLGVWAYDAAHPEPDPYPELPPPLEVDPATVARATVFRQGYNDQSTPLKPELQAEIDALVGTTSPTPELGGAVYNQPIQMLTLSEAAEVLQISATSVRRLMRCRRLHGFIMGSTVRVRSDLVWALRHRPDLPALVGVAEKGPAYRPTPEIYDEMLGLPLADVAAILRVSIATLRRWNRRAPKWFPIMGRGQSAVIPSGLASSLNLPYTVDQLRRIEISALVSGLPRSSKRAIAEHRRRMAATIAPEQVRRTDTVIDSATHQTLWTLAEIAKLLSLTVSGARKAVAAAGIPHQISGGVARVRNDDVMALVVNRGQRGSHHRVPKGTKPPPEPTHLPITVAARRIGVTVRTLRRWIAARKVEAITRDEQLWLRDADVKELARERGRAGEVREERDWQHYCDSRRGATLTGDHVINYMRWMEKLHPEVEFRDAILNRAAAAKVAGCRPSMIEQLVGEGLIPARRESRELFVRHCDLIAAGVFSTKVARMCPNLYVADPNTRRDITCDYLSIDFAASFLKRPTSEIRQLIREKSLRSVKFGSAHQIHVSEVSGPGYWNFMKVARPFRPLKFSHPQSQVTVNEAANRLEVSERTVLRWVGKGALLGGFATRKKWKFLPTGAWMKVDVPTNRGGGVINRDHVEAARRLRQINGKIPPDPVRITMAAARAGNLPQVQPWQQYVIVEPEQQYA